MELSDRELILDALSVYKRVLLEKKLYGDDVYEYSDLVCLINKIDSLANKYKEENK